VIEEHHDDGGIIWPATLAPYQVIIIPIKYDGAMKAEADKLAAELEKAGVEVLLDDRSERAGVKFNDADLLGIPYRAVIGDKNLALSPPMIEVKRRREKENRVVEIDKAAAVLIAAVREELAELNG
jgi:prolyl-tRNA synthetase